MLAPPAFNPTLYSDSVERSLGRAHWGYDDYVAEGQRQIDADETPFTGALRTNYPIAYAQVAMPPAKLAAEMAHRKALRDIEFA